MNYTKQFTEIGKGDAETAGGKGASLGEMAQAGIAVPPGFVVLVSAFEQFLSDTDLSVEIGAILDTVNTAEMHTVEHASEKIQGLILQALMPESIKKEILEGFNNLGAEYVAVRSSATAEDSSSAAWAGQLDSFLNTTAENLLANIQKCWASLYTPRAIFYGFEKGFHSPSVIPDKPRPGETRSGIQAQANLDPGSKAGMTKQISVAVVVQAMVQSEISGIAFSVHPVTEDPNQLIIEAGYGLGEAIVSGQVTPDSYVVTKQPLEIIDKNISTQERMLVRSATGGNDWVGVNSGHSGGEPLDSGRPKLSDAQILELSQLIIKIENHYGFPCDIEWAFVTHPEPVRGGQFYITQSRPITTLSGAKSPTVLIESIRNYQRLFQWRGGGLPYLFSDLYMQTYKSLECIIVSKNGVWTNYLPRHVIVSTLVVGADLLRSEEDFSAYKNDFEHFREESRRFFKDVTTWKDVDLVLFDRATELFIRLFSYYSKAEFFYTDKAYQESAKNETLQRNLLAMAIIKEWGRSLMNEMFFSSGNFFDAFLSFLGARFGLSLNDVKLYSVFELRALFRAQIVSPEEIARRKDAFIFYVEHGAVATLSGREVDTFLNIFLESETTAHTVLKGTVANSGTYTSLVKVIHYGYEDFEAIHVEIAAMNQGDILVAESTSPELLLACKKAGAILTNQGGLLSHAAIISRELSVPCVVGLGNATDVLHDGDLVEVDANSGVVRILERAK